MVPCCWKIDLVRLSTLDMRLVLDQPFPMDNYSTAMLFGIHYQLYGSFAINVRSLFAVDAVFCVPRRHNLGFVRSGGRVLDRAYIHVPVNPYVLSGDTGETIFGTINQGHQLVVLIQTAIAWLATLILPVVAKRQSQNSARPLSRHSLAMILMCSRQYPRDSHRAKIDLVDVFLKNVATISTDHRDLYHDETEASNSERSNDDRGKD